MMKLIETLKQVFSSKNETQTEKENSTLLSCLAHLD